jgi:ABC-type nickel/cobalt efflux system permease component RcnA
LVSSGTFALLGLGLVYGLKHATEADHIVAVSTIVSEHRNVWRSAFVGGLWGIGHTLSLVVVGILVLALRIAIPESVSSWLELGVAAMIIALGASALFRALRRRRAMVHLHKHSHEGVDHIHLHFHEPETEHAGPVKSHSHAIKQVGIKPLLVGAMHGLAGSGALIIIVLAQTGSVTVGLLYLAIFGLGSIGGMLLMSALVGLPFALSSRLTGIHHGLQTAAGVLSIAFGIWYGYEVFTAL